MLILADGLLAPFLHGLSLADLRMQKPFMRFHAIYLADGVRLGVHVRDDEWYPSLRVQWQPRPGILIDKRMNP